MEIGPFGGTGSYAVSRVAVEHRVDHELAPIPRHDTEAGTALGTAMTCALAMTIHVQVKKFNFIVSLCIRDLFLFALKIP